MYITIAVIGYIMLAVVFILDKFILTKSVPKVTVYTFYSTIFMLGALLLLPFGGGLLVSSTHWLISTLSGGAFGVGIWTLYIAVKAGEASHVNPYSGAIVTISTFILAGIFLGEDLSSIQQMGVGVLVIASILLSYQKTENSKSAVGSFFWATVSGIAFAISHVSAKYIYSLYPFITGFVWTKASTGLFALFFLLVPAVRKSFRMHAGEKKTFARRHSILIVIVAKVLAIMAVILIQYAIATGETSVVVALSGLQFAFMFIAVVFLTRFAPRVFREYFTKREYFIQSCGIILVVIGSLLFL
jgi:uncharacterized membrane protein